ncbi:MAG: hypothetical protein AAF571_12435 [Verrucomicrobiota bacterium]
MPYFQVMIRFSKMMVIGLAWSAGFPLSALATDMEPSLGSIFPLALKDESVKTANHILLNKTVILPEGTTLRCCFQMPEENSADVKKKEKKNNLENTFSRKPIKVSSKDENFNPYREAVKERAFQTVWTNPDLFRGYFHKVQAERYYLVYQLPGSDAATFAQFFFPEGLFLASDGEYIRVLSVQIDSRGAQAGFLPGDRIHALEDLELKGDLKLFINHYLSTVKKNKLKGVGLSFQVSPKESDDKINREVKLPLSLHSDPFGPIGG